MTIGGKIRRYRKLAGLTTEELAKRVNVSRPTISRYESDEINISVDMIGKIAKALDISPVELLDLSYLDSEVEAVPVPTLGEVAGGPPIDALEDAYEEFSISKALAQRGTFATFKIKGNSMAPRINDGDVVLVQYGAAVDSGDVAIVMMGQGDLVQVTCKKVFFLEGGKVKLQAYNEEIFSTKVFTRYELEEMSFRILGKVVLVVRNVF